MRDLTEDLLAAGGATTRVALRGLGHDGRRIQRAVEAGALLAVGRSWVVLPDADPAIAIALRGRGLVGGATALRTFGVWVTAEPPVQVATRPHANPGALAVGERVWGTFAADDQPWRVDIVDALVQHCRRVEKADAIASLDSAWHKGLIDEDGIARVFADLPRRSAIWRRQLDRAAESGLESLLRVDCGDRGWRVVSQPPAPGGGRSDLLVEDWLYIEADGRQWHDEPRQAEKDRQRNTAVMLAGGRWLRFGYAEVVHRRPATVEAIATVLRQGRPR